MSNFRKLKFLHFKSVFLSLVGAFANCKSLESLSISLGEQVALLDSDCDVIRNILKSNKRLKKLELHEIPVFSEDLSSGINFRLTELKIYPEYNGASGALHQKNFNLFLMTQRNSLEHLILEDYVSVEVLKTISSMPRLKKLSLGTDYL